MNAKTATGNPLQSSLAPLEALLDSCSQIKPPDIKFACPACGSTLTVPDEDSGTFGECPACKQPVKVPGELKPPKPAPGFVAPTDPQIVELKPQSTREIILDHLSKQTTALQEIQRMVQLFYNLVMISLVIGFIIFIVNLFISTSR